MDGCEFVAELSREFPDIAEELDDETCQDLLYVQTGVFARYTQTAIDHGDRGLTARCFLAADRAAAGGDDAVRNAIGVSFLEHLNFQDGKVRREWAFDLLSERLKADAAGLGVAPGYRRP